MIPPEEDRLDPHDRHCRSVAFVLDLIIRKKEEIISLSLSLTLPFI